MANEPKNSLADLDAAFAAQKAHSEKVKASVDELRQVSAQGKASGKNFIYAMAGLAFLVFVALSAVMLADPRARVAYFCLMPFLVLGGAWSYYRKQVS